jgi:hypothetical protein
MRGVAGRSRGVLDLPMPPASLPCEPLSAQSPMFRANFLMCVLGVTVVVGASNFAAAQSTCSLPVTAYLTDPAGAPLDGVVDTELRFYLDEDVDAVPAECRSASVAVDGGWLRILVDVCSPPEPGDCGVISLNSVFESSDAVWVGIRVGLDADELTPRQLVGAVPYAVHAASAASLEGFDPDDYVTVEGQSDVARTGAFGDLVDVPDGLSDGDDDTLGVLVCTDGESAVFDADVGGWVCGETGALAGLDCADGDVPVYDEVEGAFRCVNFFDKDGDTTLVWDDCDDEDPLLNHVNFDGDQSSSCDGDCVDDDASINPENIEVCGNDVDENCDGIIGGVGECFETYTGGGQTVYRLGPIELPAGDAASWYQGICESAGLRPVSCDPAFWSPSYDASDFNAVILNAAHYGCNVSSGIMGLTGWTDVLTFHQPYSDTQGVCQNGCTIDGDPVYPICTD